MSALATLVQIADQVAQDLTAANGLNFAGTTCGVNDTPRVIHPVNACRVYVPRKKVAEMIPGEYDILVSVDSESSERNSRTSLLVTYTIEIGLFCNLPDRSNDTIDDAMAVLQCCADYHFQFGLGGGRSEVWMHNEPVAWPDRQGLAQGDAFLALWVATFNGSRQQVRRAN